jgi:hypothetical protein
MKKGNPIAGAWVWAVLYENGIQKVLERAENFSFC